ncbi:MAG: hypothetical protein B6D39_05160 [Anaerolineae bacterium UTCFX2]|nr:sugar-binding transcriptional regulator [Anaerolineae bacterium]MCZ7554061.1 sugar-binding transcriptional regulator [Anaerolineales bacterium]OQY92067.1 MAG: hypothetical protein B6D39_05160 [Anaerolineae bacterium UTCFX2]
MVDWLLDNDYLQARLMNRILNLYYVNDLTQSDIAHQLGLSTTKVNRLLQLARRNKMVEFAIKTPFQYLFDMEAELQKHFDLHDAWIVPLEGSETSLRSIGMAGARFLLNHLQDGDVIAVGGGATIYALVESVVTERKYQVEVVPAVGGIQGRSTTDVNFLASQLAERLGGRSYQLFSPAFVETPDQREALLQMAPIKEVLDIARRASIALIGVGTVDPNSSRFVLFTALSPEEMLQITELYGGVGETLAVVYDIDGNPCAPEYADRVVGLSLDELKRIPLRLGVASSAEKSQAIYGALRGGHLSSLVTDEAAANGVIDCCLIHQDVDLPVELKRSRETIAESYSFMQKTQKVDEAGNAKFRK